MYVDDTYVYIPCRAESSEEALSQIINWVPGVKKWMLLNYLKPNYSKTDVLVLRKKFSK